MTDTEFPALRRGLRRLMVALALIFVLVAAGVAVYAGAELFSPVRLLQVLAPLVLAVLAAIAARARIEVAISLLTFLVSAVILVLASNWWLSRPEVINSSIADARKFGVLDFDTRSSIEVIEESGQTLRLPVHPEEFYSAEPTGRDGRTFVPFGSVAKASIVLCNENGHYKIQPTDEAGFANPIGSWSPPRPTDIMLIGDSYTEGWCVPDEATLAGTLRASGRSVINLGRGGTGSLVQMGILREYLPLFRPKLVVWVFYDNDFDNIVGEKNSPVLMHYLSDPAFSLDMGRRLDEANEATAAWEQAARDRLIRRQRLPLKGLRHFINGRLALMALPTTETVKESNVDGIFRDIMTDTKARIEAQGAKLLFVYLADYKSVHNAKRWAQQTDLHDRVMAIVKDLGIETVDTVPVALNRTDPALLHNFGTSGHYTAEGYGQVLAPLFQRLKEMP